MMLIGMHEKAIFKDRNWQIGFPICRKCLSELKGIAFSNDSTVLCSECIDSKLQSEFEQITILAFPHEEKAEKYGGETVFYGLKMKDIFELPRISTLEYYDAKKVPLTFT